MPGHGGKFAFEAELTEFGSNGLTFLQQTISLDEDAYFLSFWSFFDGDDGSFIVVNVDDVALLTVQSATNPSGDFAYYSVAFSPIGPNTNIQFDFHLNNYQFTVKLDVIAVTSSIQGSIPPIISDVTEPICSSPIEPQLASITTSATSSMPTSTTAPICVDTGIVQNGGFECGISPWDVFVENSDCNTSIAKPGRVGEYAFQIDRVLQSSAGPGLAGVTLQQTIKLMQKYAYRIELQIYFEKNGSFTITDPTNTPVVFFSNQFPEGE